MRVATDIAHVLDYIHNNMGLSTKFVHNHIKSSGIIMTMPSFNGKICHFRLELLCGEIGEESKIIEKSVADITDESSSSPLSMKSKELKPSERGTLRLVRVREYMSSKFQSTGVATQKSDVYAFGLVMLELLLGKEPLKNEIDRNSGESIITLVIEMARDAINSNGVKMWVDRRLIEKESQKKRLVQKRSKS